MGGEDGAIARQCKTQCFGQAVHRVGSEHAGTGAAGRTGGTLHCFDIGVRGVQVHAFHDRIDQVNMNHLAALARQHDLAGFHWSARDKHHGNVDSHCRHQHARRDLVAVRDAHHRVGAMCIDHVLDRVGDEFARGQRIEHPVMAHCNAIIDGDGVEFLGDAAGRLYFASDHLAEVLQVDVTRHELGEGVNDGNDRFAEVAVLHAGGAPERAGAGHVTAVGRGL